MNDHAVPDGSWRIADSDREAAAQALGEHYAIGRLDKAEYDERVDRAWAARTNLELPPLFADLPAPRGTVVGAEVAAVPGRDLADRRTGWPRRRGALGPLFLLIPLAFLLHAPWLLLVLFLAWRFSRPVRRWR